MNTFGMKNTTSEPEFQESQAHNSGSKGLQDRVNEPHLPEISSERLLNGPNPSDTVNHIPEREQLNEAEKINASLDIKEEQKTTLPPDPPNTENDKESKKSRRKKKAKIKNKNMLEASLMCRKCNASFSSRSKLFTHLQESGHARAQHYGCN